MIIPKHYENLDVLHENLMPNRSYYIPASKRMDNLVNHREESDRFQLLKGEWNFQYYSSIYDLQEKFYEVDFEYKICKTAPKAYLNFEGVDSCFYVWLNGKYIGYSQVPHSTSEFDVTEAIVNGKNRIAVLVLKWCDGSYLEDQDKIRRNGIFRDVYILKRPENGIFDYFVKTKQEKDHAIVKVEISYFNNAVPTVVNLYDEAGLWLDSRCIESENAKAVVEFEIKNPILWNAENPYLYKITFETMEEVIVDRVGIRKIDVKDQIVLFNDKPIGFKGVNWHDSDPVTGCVSSIEQLRKDLRMMKQYNFNAIHSDYYPNAPYFYELCDEYGFYAVNEGCVGSTLDRTQKVVERDKNRPCIVSWSMDNECAHECTFEESVKWIKEFDNSRLTHLCGGFFVEWTDRAAEHGKTEDGRSIYYYDGEHKEEVRDSNLYMDGLVFPDRIPHTGLLEYMNKHRPVRVEAYDQENGILTLHNYLDFTNAKDYLNVRYEVNCDGEVLKTGILEHPAIEPHGTTVFNLPVSVPEKGKAFLKLTYETVKETTLIPAAHMLGFDEVALNNLDSRNQKVIKVEETFGKSVEEMTVKENDTVVLVEGNAFKYYLNKQTGLFDKLLYDGIDQIMKPMEVNIWRAPTDNDMYIKQEWHRARYDKTSARAYNTMVEKKENTVVIKSLMSLAADGAQRILEMETVWTVDALGVISLETNVRRCPELPILPRFGVRLYLDKKMEMAQYYGMGPMECYIDKHQAASHGEYVACVRDLHEDYIKPQENGSHYDCSYVLLESDCNGIMATSESGFSFNASVYTQEELTAKKHDYELKESEYTVLCLDYAQKGIGSNSCGSEPSVQYKLDQKEFDFKLKLVPYKKGE